MNRRDFIGGTAVSAAAFASRALLAQATGPKPALASDPERPQYHLLPKSNWMNDPNGPIYFNGRYHMFFQYNPEAAVWGNMSWNHAISEDMLHWKNQPVAFTMKPGGPDAAGCFSGSTIAVPHNGGTRVYALYTGVVRDREHATIHNEGLRESQCLAWSDHPMLLSWTKEESPVIDAPPPNLRVTGFRDPSVWRHGERYLMAVGSGIEDVGGCLLLYSSTDLRHWKYLHPVAVGSWTGRPTPDPVDDGEMWECPELFPLGDRWVLVYSSLRRVFWQSGMMDERALRFIPSNGGMLDNGAFYAPKTQVDAHGRRILWGWVPEKRSEAEMRHAGWSGMMSLPRVLRLDSEGTLLINPLPEIAILREKELQVRNSGTSQLVTLPASTGEAICEGNTGRGFDVVICLGTQTLRLQYLPEKHRIQIDEAEVHLRPQDSPVVHMFADGSVLELFISGLAARTVRFYFQGESAPDVTVQVEGSPVTLQGWTLRPISNNRLTTLSDMHL